VPLFPGVRDTFRKIKIAGLKIFATSGSRTPDLEVLFRRHEIPCDLILGSDEIPKGDEHIQRFAEFVKLPVPEFCRAAAYVGDGPHDMVIATQHQILAIGISTTMEHAHLRASGADVIISKIEELLEI
jgi:phosphoglycolate phosphatase-like HAD superfamily hydrolase